ncbi:MAG: DUF4339 domain-containing protein [Verrucomicrobiota bacterium]|nr:hypothetical protein [Opitutae bacterium]MEC8656124.1 DUF4339 domain-containing protein [Verrucomicrobiota bacterium]MEC8866709.1 DUF4339 domain-containing protein [Verrucomicrobiota bacterium]
MNLYVSRDGQTFGPYTKEQACQFLEAGQLLATDLALYEGSAEWSVLGNLLNEEVSDQMTQTAETPSEAHEDGTQTHEEADRSKLKATPKPTGKRTQTVKGLNKPKTIIIRPKKGIFARIFSTLMVFTFLLVLAAGCVVGAYFAMPNQVAPVLRKFGVPVDDLLSGVASPSADEEKSSALVEPKNMDEIIISEDALETLRFSGIRIQPMEKEKGLQIITSPDPDLSIKDEDLGTLLTLSSHIVSLDLTNSKVTDQGIASIMKLGNLKKLILEGTTGISVNGARNLRDLSKLEYLNLIRVKLDDSFVDVLISMTNLREVYLFETELSEEAVNRLKTARPKMFVNAG